MIINLEFVEQNEVWNEGVSIYIQNKDKSTFLTSFEYMLATFLNGQVL